MDHFDIFDIRTFLQHSSDAWGLTDLNGDFRYVNSCFFKYLGLEKKDIAVVSYKSTPPLTPLINKIQDHFNLVLKSQRRQDAVATLQIDDAFKTFIFEISPHFHNGTIIGSLFHIRHFVDTSLNYFLNLPFYGEISHTIPVKPFTSREWEVIFLLYRGISKKKISSVLDIKETSVRNIISRIFMKVNLSGKDALLLYGFQNNWHLYVPPRFINVSYKLLLNF